MVQDRIHDGLSVEPMNRGLGAGHCLTSGLVFRRSGGSFVHKKSVGVEGKKSPDGVDEVCPDRAVKNEVKLRLIWGLLGPFQPILTRPCQNLGHDQDVP